jgi:A/G-specific adenine glycosylase
MAGNDSGHVSTVAPIAGNLDLASFQRQILDWYAVHRRDLPWRGDPDPYHVLLSEVMLQQTTVQRVVPKYHEFLARFPTIADLAEASTADVLRSWAGMGYNRRALNLKRAAEVVSREHGGVLPSSVELLERLPGIGRYTARAVACFAFGVQVAVVDTNVRRVLSGFAGGRLSEGEVDELARQLLPAGGASEWNQALMDYGALVYRAKRGGGRVASEPFITSNRFWRGRIVDTLRAHPTLSLAALLDSLPSERRDETRVRSLVRALHEEGLVQYDADRDEVALPP